MGEQIKVHYRIRDSVAQSSAYVDSDTLEGTNKHNDIPLKLAWSEEEQLYIQIDEWSWVILPDGDFMPRDEFYARMNQINPKPPFKRVQPKRLPRSKRRKKK